MNQIGILMVAVILLIGGFFAYNKTPSTVDAPAINTTVRGNTILITDPIPTTSKEVSNSEIAVKEFIVTGAKFSFTPNMIEVKKGDKVKIIFKNSDGFHDLKLDEFNVATSQIQTGAEESVEFIADKAGSFEYYCSVGSHRQMGMKGTLIVKE